MLIRKFAVLVVLSIVLNVFLTVLIWRYLSRHELIHLSSGSSRLSDGMAENNVSVNRCAPLNELAEPTYSVELDGVRYPQVVPLHFNASLNFECLNRGPLKRIYYWNRFWHSNAWEFGYGVRKPFKKFNCPVTNCEVTNDPAKFNESHVALIHSWNFLKNNEYLRTNKFPAHKPSGQRWIFTYFESPISHDYVCYKNLSDKFDLINTFHETSDFNSIYYSNAHFEWKLNKSFDLNFDYHATKTKFAAALISDCITPSSRGYLIKKLSRYIDVDVFGNCGHKCPLDGTVDCRGFIASKYKFFFAFENSLCTEYVTEKFFRTLNYDIVPVVFGYGNYTRYVPRSAFIHVLDFNSPKELAEHLLYVDNNPSVYNRYFAWRQHVTYHHKRWSPKHWPKSSLTSTFHMFCELCIRLNMETHFGERSRRIDHIESLYDINQNCKAFKFNEKKRDEFLFKSVPNKQHTCNVPPRNDDNKKPAQ